MTKLKAREVDEFWHRIESYVHAVAAALENLVGTERANEEVLAVAEQLGADQPRGIRAEFERLRAARGDEHAALHALLECLGEVIWSAQRHGTPPDAALYIACLERQR